MNTNENAITVKELRSLLFNLENQEMTVKELRAMLFSVDDQSQKLEDSFSVFKKIENDYNGQKVNA